MISRRNLLKGIGGSLIAAPFVVQSGVLMPVKKIVTSDDDYQIGDVIHINGIGTFLVASKCHEAKGIKGIILSST